MAETRKTFQIRQPQDVRYSGHGSGGFTASLEWDAGLAASTDLRGSDMYRPYGTGNTVPERCTEGSGNAWHGYRFRSDRAVHTICQKTVL